MWDHDVLHPSIVNTCVETQPKPSVLQVFGMLEC
jgi:hypothetical protein